MAYQITEEMLQRYEKALLREEHAQSTAHKYLRDIRAFWGWIETGRAGQEKEADGEEGRKKEYQEEKSKAGKCEEEPGRMVGKELVAQWKKELVGKGMARAQIWKEMKKLCGAAGVKASKVFPHNLRHLFARTFYKACKDIVKLADVLGHSSIDTTRIYLISTGEVHARQMDRLGLVS